MILWIQDCIYVSPPINNKSASSITIYFKLGISNDDSLWVRMEWNMWGVVISKSRFAHLMLFATFFIIKSEITSSSCSLTGLLLYRELCTIQSITEEQCAIDPARLILSLYSPSRERTSLYICRASYLFRVNITPPCTVFFIILPVQSFASFNLDYQCSYKISLSKGSKYAKVFPALLGWLISKLYQFLTTKSYDYHQFVITFNCQECSSFIPILFRFFIRQGCILFMAFVEKQNVVFIIQFAGNLIIQIQQLFQFSLVYNQIHLYIAIKYNHVYIYITSFSCKGYLTTLSQEKSDIFIPKIWAQTEVILNQKQLDKVGVRQNLIGVYSRKLGISRDDKLYNYTYNGKDYNPNIYYSSYSNIWSTQANQNLSVSQPYPSFNNTALKSAKSLINATKPSFNIITHGHHLNAFGYNINWNQSKRTNAISKIIDLGRSYAPNYTDNYMDNNGKFNKQMLLCNQICMIQKGYGTHKFFRKLK